MSLMTVVPAEYLIIIEKIAIGYNQCYFGKENAILRVTSTILSTKI